MAYVDIPLSKFIGGGSDLVERLYSPPPHPDDNQHTDYDKLMKLEPPKNYKPTRVEKPSYFIDQDLEPIFGDKQISFYDNYYLLYAKIKEYIYLRFEEDGFFKYCFKAEDDLVGCYELSNKEDIKSFLVHIVVNVPCTLYDVADNIGLNNVK
jgi:hypothetical protein